MISSSIFQSMNWFINYWNKWSTFINKNSKTSYNKTVKLLIFNFYYILNPKISLKNLIITKIPFIFNLCLNQISILKKKPKILMPH